MHAQNRLILKAALSLLFLCFWIPDSFSQPYSRRFDTLADALSSPNPPVYQRTFLIDGRDAKGDGGGGQFFYDASSAIATNKGTVFAYKTGRLIRNYSGPVNVKWFGAKGDASTDSVEAFQDACDVASASVFVPAGHYTIGSAVNVPLGISIHGETFNQVLDDSGTLIENTGTGNALVFQGTPPSQSGTAPAIISRLKIRGNTNSLDGIVCNNAQLMTIEHCYIYDHGRDGISFSSVSGPTVRRNRIQNCRNNILFRTNCTTSYIIENRLEDCESGYAAVKIEGQHDGLFAIERNIIESNDGKGVWAQPSGGNIFQLQIIRNWFELNDQIDSGDEDIFFDGSAGSYIDIFRIEGNRLNSPGAGAAIRCNYAVDGIISGNLGAQIGITNLEIDANSTDILVLWNRFAGAYSSSGTRIIRQERGAHYQLGATTTFTGNVNMMGYNINNGIASFTRGGSNTELFNSPVWTITNTGQSGVQSVQGVRVTIGDNDATDWIQEWNNFDGTKAKLWGNGRFEFLGTVDGGTNWIELEERAASPGAPDPDRARIFLLDNGAGKTQLVIRFNTGTNVVVATQP